MAYNPRAWFKPSTVVKFVTLIKRGTSLPCSSQALEPMTCFVSNIARLAWEPEARFGGGQSLMSAFAYCSAPEFRLLILSEQTFMAYFPFLLYNLKRQ